MTTESNTTVTEDTITTTETITTEIKTPGFMMRVWNKVTGNKLVLGLATTAAAGGAGYYAYMKMRDGAGEEEIANAMEQAAAAFGRAFR